MGIELQKMNERPATPDRLSRLSASATVVNSPATPSFPHGTALYDGRSAAAASISRNSEQNSEDTDSVELPDDPVQGWPQLAQLMAKRPDLAAFPRYRDLQVKSLLYYQCELSTLREKLHKLEYNDKAESKGYNEWADDLIEAGEESEQYKTMEEIRKVLKKYSMF